MIGDSGVVATVVVSTMDAGLAFVVESTFMIVVSGRAIVSIFVVVSITRVVVSTATIAVSAVFIGTTSPAADSFLTLMRCVEAAGFFAGPLVVYAALFVGATFFVVSGD
jgi:hypothetical protein